MSEPDFYVLTAFEVLLFAVLVPILWLRGWTPRSLGLGITLKQTATGVGLALAVLLVDAAMYWALPDNFKHQYETSMSSLVAQTVPLAAVVTVSVTNGLFEELFVTGYLMTGILKNHPAWTAVAASVILRTIYHIYQGAIGAASACIVGILFSFYFLKQRKLWPLIVAHALLDIYAFAARAHATP